MRKEQYSTVGDSWGWIVTLTIIIALVVLVVLGNIRNPSGSDNREYNDAERNDINDSWGDDLYNRQW